MLATALQQYAHDMIAIHIKYEYDSQIEKWATYAESVADAQQNAFKIYEGVLKRVDEDRRAAFDIAMTALVLLCGPALSWVGASLQYTYFPKKFSKLDVKHKIDNKIEVVSDYSKVHAKVFGDTGSMVVGFSVMLPLQKSQPTPATAELAAAASTGLSSFRTQLKRQLLKESKPMSNAIMQLALDVRHNPVFGARVVEEIHRLIPASDLFPYQMQESIGMGMIRTWLNSVRATWAQQWLYFGKDPATEATQVVSDKFEREMWALWIQQQDFKTYRFSPFTDARIVDGKDGNLHGFVVRRLVDLDILLAQLETIYVNGDFYPIPDSKNGGHVKAQKERLAQAKSTVPVLRDGNIDSQAEVDALNNWARNHKPEPIGGLVQDGGHARKLSSVELIYRG